ncbi:hypothetical protein ONZ45_g7960 [Pleurotus djamor]|nr:hypothetical protein ONZ45_g7960 [Pleurotus djamor]
MDRALAMISRSKSAPLFVNSSPFLTSQNLDKVASIVMSNIHRIQELDIGTRDDQKLFEFLRMNEGESASILRVLTLRGPMNPLPKDILMREMGSLQELQILKGTLASPFPSFPRLKRLHIDPTDSLTTPLLSIDVLLASLRNAPNIEELHCRQIHVPDSPPLNTPLDVVHLPRLTRLDISGLTIASSKILRLLILPQTTNITYHCQQSIPQGSNMSSLQYALLRFISVPGRVIRDISVKNQLFMLHITLDTVLRSATHTFELRLPGLANVPSDELIQLLAAVPFSKAPSLNLTGADNGIKLSPLLKLCDEVKVLTLTGCTAAAFRRLRKKADDSQVPLPKLRRLVVESCAFHISYEEQDAAMCKAMSAFLKQRKQMSMGIKELIIHDCDIIEEVVDGFRKYVKVDWDYNEIEEEEEEDYSEDNYSDYPYSMYYG